MRVAGFVVFGMLLAGVYPVPSMARSFTILIAMKFNIPAISSAGLLSRRRVLGQMAAAFAFIGVFGASIVKAAGPGPAPDGVYTLMKISGGSLIGLGTLEIKGKTYRVGDDQNFAPFTQDATGNITWSAGLNIMPDGWKLGKSAFVGLDELKRPMIKINYMSPRQAAEVIDCVKEK